MSSAGPSAGGAPWAARSCRNPRNGDNPVPVAIMIIGVAGSSGTSKGSPGGRMKPGTIVPGSVRARKFDEVP